MQRFEYKVVPAPRRGEKARGAKTTPERFALALTTLMNEMGREGWDYLRADTLPCDERVGLTGKATQFQNMLVFRRALEDGAVLPVSEAMPLPVPTPFAAPQAMPDMVRAAPLVLTPEGAAPALGPARNGVAAG